MEVEVLLLPLADHGDTTTGVCQEADWALHRKQIRTAKRAASVLIRSVAPSAGDSVN